MKFLRVKSLLCLLLIVASLAGILSGCQLASGSSSSATTTANSTPTSGEAYFPVQSVPTSEMFDDWANGWCMSPDDPYYEVNLQWAFEKMDLPDAWDITTGSGTIRVGVIDSGVDVSHEDLKNRINEDLSESFVAGVSPLEDPLGHGTHVAGIIGAQADNAKGVAGVCWNVEIVSLRVSGNDNIPDMDAVIAAIESAESKGIHILNISLTTNITAYYTDLYNAIAAFDGLVVCAAGNALSANDNSVNNDSNPIYPANIPLNNVISVGASTHTDAMWSYSHYGATTVDLFAPGSSIMNCYPTEACEDGNCNTGTHNAIGYHTLTGTSMAAPHVTGVAALLLSIHPELTAAELKQAILSSVDIVYDEDGDSVFGNLCVSGGRLNAYKALTSASVHNFSLWINVDSLHHSRTCSTCGYTESGMHFDSWDSTRGMCTICRRTDPIETPIQSILPLLPEEVEAACESGCA